MFTLTRIDVPYRSSAGRSARCSNAAHVTERAAVDAAHVRVQRPVERHAADAVQRRPARLLAIFDPHPRPMHRTYVRVAVECGYTRPGTSRGRRSAAQYARTRRVRLPVNLVLELLALVGLLLLNAFFVAAEYGLVTSRRTRIMELEHSGNRRARAVRRITSDPPRFISSMQLGVTISSLGDRRARRAGAQLALRHGDGQLPGGRPRAADRHVPARRDRRARAEGDRAQQPRADGAVRLRRRCARSSWRSGR